MDILQKQAELEKKREELSKRLDNLEKDQRRQKEALSEDSGEAAIQRENDEVVDALNTDVRQELEQVESALEHMKQGRYGICDKCGGPIAEQRLDALPYTTLCIACA